MFVAGPVHASTPTGCPGGTVDGGYPFGDAFDQYFGAVLPVTSAVYGEWRLVGTAFRSPVGAGLPNRFSNDGVEVEGSVPSIRFLRRTDISNPGFLFANASPSFVQRLNWGAQHPNDPNDGFPVSVQYLSQGEPTTKTKCLTFEAKLHGEAGDIFPVGDRRPHGRAQLYCRVDDLGLICMVEKFGRLGEVQAVDYGPVVSDGIYGFLRFQRK